MAKKLFLVSLVAIFFFLVASPVLASWPATPLLPDCTKDGNCGFNSFIELGVNLTKLILSIVGSLALLFFVYGGVMFLIAGGKSEAVTKGKTIITNAVIGLAIVLGAWVIVNFAIAALTGTSVGSVKLFGTQNWWITPGAEKTAPPEGETPTPTP